MEIEDIVNSGFESYTPVYYNKTSITDYSNLRNQYVISKTIYLEKYNKLKYPALVYFKHITRVYCKWI